MATTSNTNSTQKYIPIQEIKDGVIVMKNKGLRAVLICTSVNFALKSVDEQDALIYRYQSFLNSLDFSIQIVATSRKFNIEPYIKKLTLREREQENELLRMQTREYIEFIKGLTELANIMTESFYLVVPLNPTPIQKIAISDKFLGKSVPVEEQDEEKVEDFQSQKTQLWQRVEFVTAGLGGCGIKTVPLNTEELIELFYKLYNPSAKGDPEIAKAQDMRIK